MSFAHDLQGEPLWRRLIGRLLRPIHSTDSRNANGVC